MPRMRRHAEGYCQPVGARECPGCADEAREIEAARKLRRALASALRQINRLAARTESLVLTSDPEGEHPICTSAWTMVKRARRVAARLAPLTKGG